MNMNIENLGANIKSKRRSLKMTQEGLAELIDVNPHYIYEIEKGIKVPSLSILIAISEQLHVSIDNLLGVTDNNTNNNDDELDLLIKPLNHSQRSTLARVIRSLFPYLRL